MKRTGGFTLIELLIVMAIISILIGITIPSFRGMQNEARKTRAQADVETLKIAVEAYYNDNNNVYPAVTDYQTTLINNPIQILSHYCYDPFGATATTQYVYALSPNSSYYIIYSVGPLKTGTASVDNNGVVTSANSAIWSSNGH